MAPLQFPKPTHRTLASSHIVALLAALGAAYSAGLLRKKPNPNLIVFP